MIANNTFLNTGTGAEYMVRQFGVAVLKGDDMAYQTLASYDASSWYLWIFGETVDGPYETAADAIADAFDEDDAEHARLTETVARSYH